MEKGDRYFLVAFQHGRGVANIALSTQDGKYLNYETVVSIIMKAFKASIVGSITIISIIELPAEDHAEWVRQNKILTPSKSPLKLVH